MNAIFDDIEKQYNIFIEYINSKIKLGYWWTQCCEQDLSCIETDDDLEEVFYCIINYLLDDEGSKPGIWKTKEEALNELSQRLS